MRLTQQVVGKILDGFAWREMVGHRLVGAMIQPHHVNGAAGQRSEEHTSELQSLMRISYAVFCLQKKTIHHFPSTAHSMPTLPLHTHNSASLCTSYDHTHNSLHPTL